MASNGTAIRRVVEVCGLVTALAGCAARSPDKTTRAPAEDPAPATATRAPVEAPATTSTGSSATPPQTCDANPSVFDDAATAMSCAQDRFAAGDLDTADRLAARIREVFPYSLKAQTAEELHIDILLARQDYAAADASCERFLTDHPNHVRNDAIRTKQAAARAKSPP